MKVSRGRVMWLLPALFVTLLLGTVAPAQARNGPLLCQTAGILNITGAPGHWDWDLQVGFGQCVGDGKGPYVLVGNGTGTSDSLGLCDGLVVQNFHMDVTLHLISVLGPAFSKDLNEVWSAPITTFPIATPYLVSDASSGGLVGAGAILSHIHLQCPPNGAPSAVTIELRLR